MLIVFSSLLFFLSALALLIVRMTSENERAAWLTAAGGGALTVFSVFLWLAFLPFDFSLSAWQPQALFVEPISFHADGVIFPLALSVAVLVLSIVLTAVARSLTNSFFWAGVLALGGVGLLAITADNPLTLALAWSALDLTELFAQLRVVNGPSSNEKVVVSFSVRLLGIGLLMWGNVVSVAQGGAFRFEAISAGAGIYFILASGLRLGVLPLHLPYAPESSARRGFGAGLRLISAASSLALLTHIPAGALAAPLAPYVSALALLAALYGGWMWLRAPDELSGRPYWIIGMAALSILSALSGNPLGAAAWACALILAGGSLFLASVQDARLNRALLFGAWSLSALPFSLTGAAWLSPLGIFAAGVAAAQALLIAGFIRHVLRPAGRSSLDEHPIWMRSLYVVGISLLIFFQLFLSLAGWDGALRFGVWSQSLPTALLTAALVWAAPRFRIFNPVRAHWVNSAASRVNQIYQVFWSAYRFLEKISQTVIAILEGESGLMWTLLFLALFISLFGGMR